MVLKVDVSPDLVHGDVDEGYGAVADVFRRNFAERGEIGAACAVYRDGKPVVDLWGGYRDGRERRPWREDTIVPVFSTTKGVSSLALAVAHSRGLLDYDEPVAAYWPEFAAAGKQDVTVRTLLSHQAGLSAIDRPLTLEHLADLDVLADALAAQAPAWAPGTRHGYHATSLGWYEGELVRRVDPEHRTLGRFFADEIARPLGLDFFIGLPDDVGPDRLATIHGFATAEMIFHVHEMPWRFVAAFCNPRSLTARSFANPAALGVIDTYNRRDVLRLELPAANGVGGARAIARAYSAAISGELGLGDTTLAALSGTAPLPSGGTRDLVLRVDTRFSLGYTKPYPGFVFGSAADRAFGTMGTGGSFGFADPDTGIGFAYVMNRAGFHLWNDPRELALRDALYAGALGERPQR